MIALLEWQLTIRFKGGSKECHRDRTSPRCSFLFSLTRFLRSCIPTLHYLQITLKHIVIFNNIQLLQDVLNRIVEWWENTWILQVQKGWFFQRGVQINLLTENWKILCRKDLVAMLSTKLPSVPRLDLITAKAGRLLSFIIRQCMILQVLKYFINWTILLFLSTLDKACLIWSPFL